MPHLFPYRRSLPVFVAAPFLALATASADEPISFKKTIRPILREKCVHCHNKRTLPDKPSFESAKQAFVKNAAGQSLIVPGKPEESLLIVAIESPVMHENAMPQTGLRTTPEEIRLLRQWIAEGAKWPEGWAGRIRPTFYPKE
jgi:uncharacterized membrane protein